jgi:gamma-glutamyltranspeptidase/glutathione hydrolase
MENYLKKGHYQEPFLSNTYKKIALGGRDAFYKGEIAKETAKFIQDQGGFIVRGFYRS